MSSSHLHILLYMYGWHLIPYSEGVTKYYFHNKREVRNGFREYYTCGNENVLYIAPENTSISIERHPFKIHMMKHLATGITWRSLDVAELRIRILRVCISSSFFWLDIFHITLMFCDQAAPSNIE